MRITASSVRYAVALTLMVTVAAGCSKKDSGASGKPGGTAKPVAVAGGTPIELTPVPEGFPMGLSVSQGFALHLFDSPDKKFRKLPPDSGAKRHYDEFTIAGAPHLVVTEESNPPRFFFDENRNGDMTDDRPAAEGEKPALLPNFYSILIRYDDEKVIAPYRLWMFGSNMGGVRFYAACHWRGTLMVNGRPYTVVAFDSNADGDYSNDPVVVDANGDGKADGDETLTPGKSLTIGGRKVTFASISRSGLTASFAQ